MLVFDTSYRYTYEEPEHVADERPVEVAWHKVNDETIDRYKRRIDELIPNMIMSSDTLFCNNVLCECGNHRSDIDDVCKQWGSGTWYPLDVAPGDETEHMIAQACKMVRKTSTPMQIMCNEKK